MLAVLAGGIGVVVLADDTYVAETPSATADGDAPAGAASAALERLATALESGDRASLADLGVGRGGLTDLTDLTDLADNAAALGVSDLGLRYVTQMGPLDDDGTWTAAVDARWSFEVAGDGAAEAEVAVRLRARDGEVHVLGFTTPADGGRLPVWLGGPVQVLRRPDAVVVVADGLDPTRYAATAARAVPQVRRVLPGWRTPLVVEVPPDGDRLASAVGGDPATYAKVAAVTASVDGRTGEDAPVHVFVNPDVLGSLGGRGAQVVMTHEATHVATGAAIERGGGELPPWLLEGFADYVALRDVDLPISRTAGQVRRQVREDGLPAALPGEAEFETTGDRFGAAYEASWLACRVVADEAGQDGLVGLYDDVAGGDALDASLRRRAGFGVGGLTRRWRGVLKDVAR